MRQHSLRLRLLLISALVIICSLAVAGGVLAALFSQHIERSAVRSLTNDVNRLAALIDANSSELRLTRPMSDPLYEIPFSGLYWEVRDPQSGEIVRSRSAWDQALSPSGQPSSSNSFVELRVTDPKGSPAIAIERRLSFDLDSGGARLLELIVAQDTTETDRAIVAYRSELFRALLVLALIFVVGAWMQVTVGLAPLGAVVRGVGAIRAGQSQRLEGAFPREVQPLVSEVNELAQAQELAITFARERAADLAHGLKGNLQVLNSDADALRRKGDESAATAIEMISSEMAATIDHQLGLSRLRHRSHRPAVPGDLGEVAERIVATLQKTARGAQLTWTVEIEPGTIMRLDRHDLAELLGALLENAIQWATSHVRVRASSDGLLSRLEVDDDGPGLSNAQIELLGKRGVRLDEARSGSGIGISIVREIVALNGGKLAFSRSEFGGLAAGVVLPLGVGS